MRIKRHFVSGWKSLSFIILVICITIFVCKENNEKQPENILLAYMTYIGQQNYEAMYDMVDIENLGTFSKEEFISRNSRIYEGIEAKNIKITDIKIKERELSQITLSYSTCMESLAGSVSFENEMVFMKTKEGYKILWEDSLILPGLESGDRVKVETIEAERGTIKDRNGWVLAGKGTATSVGIVPGKLTDRESAITEMTKLLEIEEETIDKKLSEKWVTDESFVPIATIEKVSELELGKVEPDEEVFVEKERQDRLLEIPGVVLKDTEIRGYPLKEETSHLIGYVQNVTAEDLENHPEEGYGVNSVIGKSGLEALYEKELRGQDGHRISIVDENGDIKEIVAETEKQDGEDIQLTIDSELQEMLYEQFKADPGCSVALNPYTGEVLALVSTPSYDSNDFIRGLTEEKWNFLNENENRPLYNRFRQVWCPGSTFKPIIASIGLDTEAFAYEEDFGTEGTSWQKDQTWGAYHVTTLHTYEPVVLKNALIYADNIYFAKAALKIGVESMENALDDIGFNQQLPFEINVSKSQYSNSEKIETEIQLADTGYGQGQVLVNPIHLASLYTAFLNDGDIISPYLIYQENAERKVWIENAFSSATVQAVMEGLKGVVNEPEGTGYAAHREDIELAGKTGTAELKATKEDQSGTEIGWFAVFTAEKIENPVMIVSMVEDVKGMGGSGYVVRKDKVVLDEYLE